MPDRDITKEVLRMFSYGLYVASALGPDGPRAATVSWVTQASFEPRLIAVAMRKGTAICEAVAAARGGRLFRVPQAGRRSARCYCARSRNLRSSPERSVLLSFMDCDSGWAGGPRRSLP
jgi:hypothetical protein